MLRTRAVAVVGVVVMAVAAMVTASVPYGMDTLDDLYRLQQLYQMSRLQDDPYLSLLPMDDIDSRSEEPVVGAGGSLWGEADDDSDSGYDSPLFSAPAQARDQEHLEHSSLHGLHSVSGGTIEGEPPQKQVKTDKPLPAYCNPPNPCPVGKTAADNCVENFENSMDNNKRLLADQDCPCDTEHMFSCPAGQQTVTSKGNGVGQAALSKVMSELAQLRSAQDLDDMQYLASAGVKRQKLVAKKSPMLSGGVRRKRANEQAQWNPNFRGEPLAVAAKKSPAFDMPAK